MITAQEAKQIAGPTLEEKVEAVFDRIRELAVEKKRKLRTGWDHPSDSDLWQDGGYGQTEEWKKACDILRSAGFKVSFYYNEMQFVDMYTLIEW